MKRINIRSIFNFSLILTLMSCGHPKSESDPIDANIPLSRVTANGCLNLQEYFEVIRSMPASLPVMEASSDFEATSDKSIRRNFLLTLAYGIFTYQESELSDFSEVTQVEQTDCSTVQMMTPNGDGEVFKVIESGEDFISILDETTGNGFSYKWLSPTSMRIETRYQAADFSCNEDTRINVKYKKAVSWAPDSEESRVRELSNEPINMSFLSLVAEAVNLPANTFLANSTEPVTLGQISRGDLAEISSMPIKPQLLTCE